MFIQTVTDIHVTGLAIGDGDVERIYDLKVKRLMPHFTTLTFKHNRSQINYAGV
jgi:hypothetical protein